MQSNLQPRFRSPHTHVRAHGAVRDRAIKAIAQMVTLPAADGRVAGEAIRQLRKAVRRGITNKMASTLYDLLAASGRGDEVGAFIRAMFARGSIHNVPLNDALVLETDAKCEEMPVVARVLAGDVSGPELLELRDRLASDRMALELAIESVDAELTAKRMIA